MLDWLSPLHVVLCCFATPVALLGLKLLINWTDRTVFMLLNAGGGATLDEEE